MMSEEDIIYEYAKEEVILSAMKYDQLQQQRKILWKQNNKMLFKKDEIVIPKTKEEIPISKTKDYIYIYIWSWFRRWHWRYETCSTIATTTHMTMFSNDDSYSNLVYLSACDKLKEKIQDGRTKY